jgi:hypothetical protein
MPRTSSVSEVAVARPMSPRPDDVVVTPPSPGNDGYVVRRPKGRGRVEATRQDALRVARMVAIRRGVNLWFCDGPAYRLLEVYRGEEMLRHPVHHPR